MTITTNTEPTTDPVTVRSTEAHDRSLVGRVLAESFFDDPVTDWLVPDRARRAVVAPPLFELYFDLFHPHGETYVAADGGGVALWLPPGREMVTEGELEPFASRVEEIAGSDAPRMFALGEFFDAHAPTEPHWHLQLLGTLPERQGQGIGSALLRDFLTGADERGEAAYLESTTLRSRALYERHGFECQGEITLVDGPTLWQMWRPAAG